MLYKRNKSTEFDMELFKNPTSEYRGAPFWAWNCELDEKILKEQIEIFKEMGFGGFHIHSRAGMATEYLGDKYFKCINTCVAKAKSEGMLACLYDEDRWPSGFAGGFVTRTKKFRRKFMEFTKHKISEENICDINTAAEKGGTYLFGCYDIALNEEGRLKFYRLINEKDEAIHEKWYAYIKTAEDEPYFNGQSYVDTMLKEAIDEFIGITHEEYKKHIGEEFSITVPSIFTDEPQFINERPVEYSCGTDVIITQWTHIFPEEYKKRYGEDIKDTLPEIFWDLPDGKLSRTRYLYNDLSCELFVSAFLDNIGSWCEDNHINLTGHVMHEEALLPQSRYVGEAMRCYRSMQMPGIDMLMNGLELSTAKQAQSVARQYGREGMMSELYGVTGWGFDFRGHKYQGDWQAALGVTFRVPHLAWVSMKGRAKRDYPASINYQSPWYKEYSYIENHFARLNTVLTRGEAACDVAVIHPIESFWLYCGPSETSAEIQEGMEVEFSNITNWLLRGTIDFDYISEALLAENGGVDNNKFKMGEMYYKTVVVPNCETLRSTTFEALKEFKANGGRLIFVGKCPRYIDAQASDKVKELYDNSVVVSMNKNDVLNAVEPSRFISIRKNDGRRTANLVYTLRKDKNVKWLFIAHLDMPKLKDSSEKESLTIEVKGEFIPELYDTISGEIIDLCCDYKNGKTLINTDVYEYDSLLIRLEPGMRKEKNIVRNNIKVLEKHCVKHPLYFETEEPNVYLLDMAEYSLDGSDFCETEEILRIDKKCRANLGFPDATIGAEQPWAIEDEKISHFVTLKYTIESEIEYLNPLLALESADYVEFNGNEVKLDPIGFYVDKSILTYALPKISKGINTLLVRVPFGKRTGVESLYLLGNFGVSVSGCKKSICELPDTINFGNLTEQKMPFYSGNITYRFNVDVNHEGRLKITVGHYRGALVKVKVDGEDIGRVVYPPYELISDAITRGNHIIEITLFGNRANTFGALHNFGDLSWYDDNVWRPEKYMSYEYIFEDFGILSSPSVEIIE